MIYDCPRAEVCKTCPCAHEDDACFPGERLRAERDAYRQALEKIAGVGLKAGAPRTLTAAGNLARAVLDADGKEPGNDK